MFLITIIVWFDNHVNDDDDNDDEDDVNSAGQGIDEVFFGGERRK